MRHRDTILSTATFLLLALLAANPWFQVKDQVPPSDLAILLASLRMEDAGTREHAATALGKRGDPRAVPPLVFVLTQDPDARVREHAATALGRLGDGRARLSLAGTILNDPDPRVREHAAAAWGRIGGGESSDPLFETPHGRDVDWIRRWAAEVVRKIGSRRAEEGPETSGRTS